MSDWLQTEFWVIGFIDHVQVVSTNNSNTIADFYTSQITIPYAKSSAACSVFTRSFLVTASNNGYSCAFGLKSSLNGGPLPTELFFRVQSSELLYDWRFTADRFVLAASPLRATRRIFIFQPNTCGYSPYVTSSLKRGWVRRLQLLLALTSQSFTGPNPVGFMTFYCLIFETLPTWRTGSPYLYPPRNRVTRLYHRHWVPFSWPPTRRATVEVVNPASTRDCSCSLSDSI
jgi:hypothetical protein